MVSRQAVDVDGFGYFRLLDLRRVENAWSPAAWETDPEFTTIGIACDI